MTKRQNIIYLLNNHGRLLGDDKDITTEDICEALSDVGSQYDYGGDAEFWILGTDYIEYNGIRGWTVETVEDSGDNANDDDLAAIVIARYYSEDTSVPEALSLLGLDALAVSYLDIADIDYNDVCKIWRRANYYSGMLLTSQAGKWLAEEDGEIICFANARDTQDYIDTLESEAYILDYGESSPPDYYIVES